MKKHRFSFCTTAINVKREVEALVEYLHATNTDPDRFEVCVVLDDRVEDGSEQKFQELSTRFKNFKFSKVTLAETIDYCDKAVSYQETKRFPDYFIRAAKRHIDEWRQGTLIDPKETFVWVSTGWRFNRARKMASGDYLIFLPVEMIPAFNINKLEQELYRIGRQDAYIKPHAIYGQLSNTTHLEMAAEIQMDYTSETRVADWTFYSATNQYKLGNGDWWNIAEGMAESEMTRVIRYHHGLHILPAGLFDRVGGFTEVWHGRAFAEDNLTLRLGTYRAHSRLSMAAYYPMAAQGKPKGAVEKVDGEWYGKHPYFPLEPFYLGRHHEVPHIQMNALLGLYSQPVKF